MKTTWIEKGMLVCLVVVYILILAAMIQQCEQIEKKGLKSVVNELWEGTDAKKTEENHGR